MYIPPSLQNLFAVADKRGNNGTFMTSPHTDQLGRVVTWTDPPGPAFNKYLDETDAENMNTRAWVKQSNNWIVLRYANRKSTRLNSSHRTISYAVFCLKKKKKNN